jgi:hypothetical protein
MFLPPIKSIRKTAMKMSKVIWNAKKKGIVNASKLTKPELIHAIQTKEGNTPCFATGVKDCGRYACLWWQDCRTLRHWNVTVSEEK